MQLNLPNPEVMAEAERWFARLKAEDCTGHERTEFLRWRIEPEHAEAYERTERLWQSIGDLRSTPVLEELSQRVLTETESPRHLGRQAAIAASVMLAITGAALLFLMQPRDAPASVYSTQPGERSTVRLADGSQLDLNVSTEVEVRLGQVLRRIVLKKGEALFRVSHDANRPFRVSAGDGEVTALGTRFEVRADSTNVAVTLLEGRVSLERQAEKEVVELKPGDQVRFRVAEAPLVRRSVDPDVVSSWSSGRLRFRATPLGEVVEEVNRYSSATIHIVDPALAAVPINGTFDVGDSASVVSALEALLLVRAERTPDGQVFLRRRD